jgi:hypothetical protein
MDLDTAETPTVGSLMLLDTARETEIGLGVNYPYPPQAAGQCMISSGNAFTLNTTVNAPLTLSIPATVLLNTFIKDYNLQYEPQIEEFNSTTTLDMTCTISAIMDKSYGKYSHTDT